MKYKYHMIISVRRSVDEVQYVSFLDVTWKRIQIKYLKIV